jgi:hypothetical protein
MNVFATFSTLKKQVFNVFHSRHQLFKINDQAVTLLEGA